MEKRQKTIIELYMQENNLIKCDKCNWSWYLLDTNYWGWSGGWSWSMVTMPLTIKSYDCDNCNWTWIIKKVL